MARPVQTEAEQAGILVWGRLTAMIAEAVTPLLIVRLIDKPEFGAYAALMLVYTTFAVMLTAGLPASVLYFLADRTRGQRAGIMRSLNRVTMLLGVGMAFLMAAIGYFGPDVLAQLGETLGSGHAPKAGVADELVYLPILGLYALFDFPTRLLPNLLIAERRPRSAAGIGVVRSVAVTIGTLVPAALGFGVFGILIGITAVAAGHAALYFGIVHHLYSGAAAAGHDDDLTARSVLAYCIPLGASQITNTLNGSLDQWLIVTLFPAERVAVYKAGAYQIPILTTVAYTLGAVYMPRFTKLFRENRPREAMKIWRASILKVSLLIVPASLVFIVAAEEFTVLAFTEEYADAAGVFRAYCFLVLARVTAFGAVMLAAGRPGFVLRSSALTLVANVCISVPLTFAIGFYGPAIGTALAFIPTLWFYNYYVARAAGVRMNETFPLLGYLRVLAVASVPAAAAFAFKFSVTAHPALMFLAEATIVVGGWAWLGTKAGLIEAEDWTYAKRWMRLDVFR